MSTLRNWRKALEEQWDKVADNPKQYYHAEMMNLLQDAEREVAEAKKQSSDDRVISHTLRGGMAIEVPEALTVHTLTNLLKSLPLPVFHHLTKLNVDPQGEYNPSHEWAKTGKYDVNVEWEEYLSTT